MLKVQLLGDVAVNADGNEVVLGPKLRLLAAYLFCKQDQWVSRDELRGLLWGDTNEQRASQNLRTSLHRLKEALSAARSPAALEIRHDAVRISPECECRVDALLFENNAAQGLATEASDIAKLVSAVNLYRGEFIPADRGLGDTDHEWPVSERDRLAGLHRSVLRALVDRLASKNLYHAAVDYAERWRDTDPFSEEASRWLMRLYAAVGEPARVLDEFERCRDTLRSELGIAPSEATVSESKKMSRLARRKAAAAEEPDPSAQPIAEPPPDASSDPGRNAALLLITGESRVRHGDVEGGMEALGKALKTYERLGDEAGQARARLVLAGVHLGAPMGAGVAEALANIQQALAYYREHGPPADLARALLIAAQAYTECGRFADLIPMAAEGMQIARSMGTRDTEMRFMLSLATAYTNTYRFGEAQEMFDVLLAEVGRLYQPPDVLLVMNSRAVLASGMGDIYLAEGCAREALAAAEHLPPSPMIARAVHGMRYGLMMILHGQDRCEELEALRSPADERALDLPGQQYIETLMLMDGNDDGVLSCVQEWLRAALPSLPPWWSDAYVRLLAEVLLGCDRDREASRWAAVAARRGRLFREAYHEAYARCQWGVALARLGNTKAAAFCAARARELAKKCPSNWTPAWLAYLDGLVALGDGDSARARKLLNESTRLFGEIGCLRLARLPQTDLERAGLAEA